MSITILFAHRDPRAMAFAEAQLANPGRTVVAASELDGVDQQVASGRVDVLVLDTALIGARWIDWLCATVERWPDLPIVLTAEEASEAESCAALRAGAAGFVTKPLEGSALRLAVDNGVSAAEVAAAGPPSQYAQRDSTQQPAGTSLVGGSEPMREIAALVRRAAASAATVLVRGESGTGKEVIARRIHELSPRCRGPFVKVHCAALPEPLLESELFGYEKGAFTGATSRKPGRLEIAEGGTLFLDEIGDISPAIQVKLLRVLQDREYECIGGTRTIHADVRFVAATHRALEQMLERGEFREDLYYRLNVVPIFVPPLRARAEDIEPLVQQFCSVFGAQNGKPRIWIAPEAIEVLSKQPWPGNVRQLQNFIERLVVFADTEEIGLQLVKTELSALGGLEKSNAPTEVDFGVSVLELDEVVRRAERKALQKALRKSGGNRTVAARILGVSRRTLYNKLEEHGLAGE